MQIDIETYLTNKKRLLIILLLAEMGSLFLFQTQTERILVGLPESMFDNGENKMIFVVMSFIQLKSS